MTLDLVSSLVGSGIGAALIGGVIVPVVKSAVATAVQQAAARELEFLKGRIGLDSQLQLRLHDKEWDLLCRIGRAMLGLYYALVPAVTSTPNAERVLTIRASFSDLEALIYTCPPNVDFGQMRGLFKRAFARIVEVDESIRGTGPFMDELGNLLDDAVDAGKTTLAEWNSRIWSSTNDLLQTREITRESEKAQKDN